MFGKTGERVVVALLAALFAALVAGQLLGQPMLLAYVDPGSTSMEPTIGEGDGFVAIPSAVATSPQEGDVVTFYAEEIEGGGLTTHRVVDETADGYITRGDANPFTDQDGGEPPVTEDDIVAKALQVGGYTVTIPHLGTAIEAVQTVFLAVAGVIAGFVGLDSELTAETLGLGLFALGLVLFVASLAGERRGAPGRSIGRSTGSEDRLDARKVALAVLIVVLLPANAAMMLPAGDAELVIDGDEVADADGVAPGDDIETELEIRNDAFLTMVFAFEAPGEDVALDRSFLFIPPGAESAATVTAPAPEPGTERTVTAQERRYFLLFPESVIMTLHETHPYAAIGALNLFLTVSVFGFIGGLFGFGEVRFRETDRDVPLVVALKRQLRP